jgi:hypothetical protein
MGRTFEMNNYGLEKWQAGSESNDARKIDAALAQFGQVEKKSGGASRCGRLIVALDLTGSREWSLKQAGKATAAMLEAIAALGSVTVKLVFFRGRECKAGPWQDDADAVCRSMLGLSCMTGHTKIGRVLRLVRDEPGPISGVVYIGDHCEEEGDELTALAGQLGEKHIPVFVFHECADDDDRWIAAKPIFKAIAAASSGAYTEFKPDSGAVLRELLSNIGAFSAAGVEGVKQIGQATTPEARQLQGRLLLLGPAGGDDGEKRITK